MVSWWHWKVGLFIFIFVYWCYWFKFFPWADKLSFQFMWSPLVCLFIENFMVFVFRVQHGNQPNGNSSWWNEQTTANSNVASTVSWLWHNVWCHHYHSFSEGWWWWRLHEDYTHGVWVGTRIFWSGHACHEWTVCFIKEVNLKSRQFVCYQLSDVLYCFGWRWHLWRVCAQVTKSGNIEWC